MAGAQRSRARSQAPFSSEPSTLQHGAKLVGRRDDEKRRSRHGFGNVFFYDSVCIGGYPMGTVNVRPSVSMKVMDFPSGETTMSAKMSGPPS